MKPKPRGFQPAQMPFLRSPPWPPNSATPPSFGRSPFSRGGERDRDRDFSRGGSVSPILIPDVVERERETAANRSR